MKTLSASATLAITAVLMAGSVRGQDRPRKIVITKADEIGNEPKNWQ
jgi:hypothetical protein